MKFSPLILRNLSKKITAGYPVTAIATANQYLKKNCPIRKALVTQASFHSKLLTDKNVLKIFAGHKLKKVCISEAISNFDYKSEKTCGQVPAKFGRTKYKRRSASRIRNKILKGPLAQKFSNLNKTGRSQRNCQN